MKFGASFPNTQIGNDPIAIKDYGQALDEAGFDYLQCPTHDLGAHPDRFGPPPFKFRPANSGNTYTYETPWHELLILYTFLAAHTQHIRFVPTVIYLSQRQAALAAKQIAEIDILSGGRFQPMFGTGWNFTEYEALGMDWESRAERMDESLQVLKLLWSQPVVEFHGNQITIDRMGINPLPATQPLPIWYAGSARNVVLKRAVDLCDGFYSLLIPPEEPKMAVDRLQKHLKAAGKEIGKNFSLVGTCRRTSETSPPPPPPPGSMSTSIGQESWLDRAKLWRDLGATHLTVGASAGDLKEMLRLSIESKKILEEEGLGD